MEVLMERWNYKKKMLHLQKFDIDRSISTFTIVLEHTWLVTTHSVSTPLSIGQSLVTPVMKYNYIAKNHEILMKIFGKICVLLSVNYFLLRLKISYRFHADNCTNLRLDC